MPVPPKSPGRKPDFHEGSKPLTIYCTFEEREWFKTLRGLSVEQRAQVSEFVVSTLSPSTLQPETTTKT